MVILGKEARVPGSGGRGEGGGGAAESIISFFAKSLKIFLWVEGGGIN